MASTIQSIDHNCTIKDESDTKKFKETEHKYEQMLQILPKENGWVTKRVVNYQGAWFTPSVLKGVMMVQNHFMALPTDILLASFPKCGTTWLKAITFAILNRHRFEFSKHPLLTKNPHECNPSLEVFYLQNQQEHFHHDSSQRVFSTHIPFHILPESIKSSIGRIVYIARDPKDVFVSSWYHMQKVRPKELPPLSIEEGFDMFCKGVYNFGPYWDHVCGYFKERLDKPEKVLILTYEDMKRDCLDCVRKIAKHLDQPFSAEEEGNGIVEEIIKLCSFETLSNLEVNKSGVQHFTPTISIENHVFFRKGGIGDWEKHITTEMAERMDEITKLRFKGTHFMSSFSP